MIHHEKENSKSNKNVMSRFCWGEERRHWLMIKWRRGSLKFETQFGCINKLYVFTAAELRLGLPLRVNMLPFDSRLTLVQDQVWTLTPGVFLVCNHSKPGQFLWGTTNMISALWTLNIHVLLFTNLRGKHWVISSVDGPVPVWSCGSGVLQP